MISVQYLFNMQENPKHKLRPLSLTSEIRPPSSLSIHHQHRPFQSQQHHNTTVAVPPPPRLPTSAAGAVIRAAAEQCSETRSLLVSFDLGEFINTTLLTPLELIAFPFSLPNLLSLLRAQMTKFRKLNRPTGHRMSMLRTMVSQLVKHERIETTVAKAKEARRLADNMVQLGKEGTLCAARRASAFVRGDDVLHKIFTELAYRYKDRAGGYTRMLRTRIRVGDAAPMAYIEFIDRENELRQAKPATPPPPQRAPLDPWTRSRLTRQYAPPKEEKITDSDS